MSYEAAGYDLQLGDVVRRRGHPLRVGIVLLVAGGAASVRWQAGASPTWHPVTGLERRTDRTEIAVR